MLDIKKLSIKASHIIFISDIHFGKHVNSEEWQDNMRNYFYNFFLPHVKKIKASLKEDEKLVCINLGDTYDDRKAIDINVTNLAIDVVEDIAKEIPMYILNGNHDLAKKTNLGNTSLRTIEYIPNVTLITDPTLLTLQYGDKLTTKIIAIPYLGSTELETNYLVEYNKKAKYALMHTELTKMKMDNGMTITNGANPDMFKGLILSGHIHKRQESKHVIYVGAPYHMNKGDINNDCGLYVLDLAKDDLSFTKNTYSPIYHSIQIDEYDSMSLAERQSFFNNNYNYVIINEDDVPKYKKKYDLNNLGLGTTAKKVTLITNKKHQSIDASVAEYKEKSISELINESINQLEIDNDSKTRLYSLSNMYLHEAEQQLIND